MSNSVVENHNDHPAGVKEVKCSMCRKVKTSDHFINPNSEVLFHVCDYCRYLRKTKYKKRRVKVELERPTNSTSRNRDVNTSKTLKHVSNPSNTESPTSSVASTATQTTQSFEGIVPSTKWVKIPSDPAHQQSDQIHRSMERVLNKRYTLNHPYYKYQNILSNYCTPPQIVVNSDNQVVVLRSSIPPAPHALIFCCGSMNYGNRYGMYDRMWVKASD